MNNINKEYVLDILKEHRDYFDTQETKNIDFRIMQLQKLKKAIKDNEKLVMEALYKDLHKSEFEAYATEIGILYESIGYITKNLKKWARAKKVKTPLVHLGSRSYIHAEPYGTVLIIGPFNYPFQLVFEPLIGAISAGNCAVIKPSKFTPNVSRIISKIVSETFDTKYIRIIEGGRETTSALINSPFDYIFFTGSINVGKVVMEAAGKNLVPVTLELGGKSPCIIDKAANLEVAAERIAWGKFMNVGQTCVAPDYILVHESVKKEFISKLIEKVKVFYGDDAKISKDYGRIVDERQVNRLIGLIDKNKVVYGGNYDIKSLYIEPTIMDNITFEDKVMEDEIFGPILPIIEYKDIKEAINKINSRPKPLALYIFTENKEVEQKVLGSVSFGGGCVNDTVTHLANPNLPFGGVGNSGLGSYHGQKSFEVFSHMKSVFKKTTRIRLKFIFPPYTKEKISLLRRAMK